MYLTAGPDPEGPPLGRTLESVAAAAEHRARLLLYADHDGTDRLFGRVSLGSLLPPGQDAALACDPIRQSSTDLHPSGTIHGVRAFAYRLSQRWRRAAPAPDNPAAVARTAEHHPSVDHVEARPPEPDRRTPMANTPDKPHHAPGSSTVA